MPITIFCGSGHRARRLLACGIAAFMLLHTYATAQNSNTQRISSKKEIHFEIISIHPVKPGWTPYDQASLPVSNTAPSPNGFGSTLTVWQMLMIAYAQNDQSWPSVQIVNAPAWLSDHNPTWYAINARVAEADVKQWRNQSSHHELLRVAMQDLLQKRCKLTLHKIPSSVPDYKLLVRKSGLKMQTATPGAALPKKTLALPSGGARFADGPRDKPTWHYYNATIDDLIEFLNACTQQRPIHDETGLKGRYNFAIKMVEHSSHDHDEQLFNWPIDALGLVLKPGKSPGFKLGIDHLERPSSND